MTGKLIFLVIFFWQGQAENKLAALPRCTDNIDMLVVGVNDFSGDGQSQSGALFIFSPGQIWFVEAVPDQF